MTPFTAVASVLMDASVYRALLVLLTVAFVSRELKTYSHSALLKVRHPAALLAFMMVLLKLIHVAQSI